jgi:hypothetical protein
VEKASGNRSFVSAAHANRRSARLAAPQALAATNSLRVILIVWLPFPAPDFSQWRFRNQV